MVLLLNECHCGLSTRADCACLPLKERAGGVCLEQLGTTLIDSSNKQGDSVWSGHWLALLAFIAFTEVDSKVTDGLCDLLNSHRLCIVEAMILSFHTSVINQDASITNDSTHCTYTVSVNLNVFTLIITYLNQFLRLGWLHELRGKLLFDSQDDSFTCLDTDGCRPEL
jgi:hypothetical protein